jgi:hypothetical protein
LELLLELSILFWGERSGKALRKFREILREDQPGLQGMALGG